MEIIVHHFCNHSAGYKKILLEEPEIKKMSMLKRQVWLVDDDEFDHTLENSQRVLRLNAQFENHPHIKEFTKEYNDLYMEHTF